MVGRKGEKREIKVQLDKEKFLIMKAVKTVSVWVTARGEHFQEVWGQGEIVNL